MAALAFVVRISQARVRLIRVGGIPLIKQYLCIDKNARRNTAYVSQPLAQRSDVTSAQPLLVRRPPLRDVVSAQYTRSWGERMRL